MRIKFLKNAEYKQHDPKTGKPCPERSKSYKEGETYEVSADHGSRWIRRNAAVEVTDEPKRGPQKMVPAPPASA